MVEIVANGIDADTGEYLIPPLQEESIAAAVAAGERDEELELEIKQRAIRDAADLAVPYGIDVRRLDSAGWAVVFPVAQNPAIQQALEPLLTHRRAVAGARYRCFAGEDGYAGGTKVEFLQQHRAPTYGAANPDRVPYYVLLVGSPKEIPFRFQRQLSIQYAVGRLDFDDVESYAVYAEAVQKTDGRIPVSSAQIVASQNPNDRATDLSSAHLASPLATTLEKQLGADNVWSSIGPAAGRHEFETALRAHKGSALTFTASHGVGFPVGDRRQRDEQGALITSAWEGPHHPVSRAAYVTGGDLDSSAEGLVAFNFACFSAGTPERDTFGETGGQPRIADSPFVSALAKQLLRRGALAVIGHVDRAWGYSFLGDHLDIQTAAYESCLRSIVDGYPVGASMEWFAQLYGEKGAGLTEELDAIERFKKPLPHEINPRWVATADAGAFAIVGDPAVRFGSKEG